MMVKGKKVNLWKSFWNIVIFVYPESKIIPTLRSPINFCRFWWTAFKPLARSSPWDSYPTKVVMWTILANFLWYIWAVGGAQKSGNWILLGVGQDSSQGTIGCTPNSVPMVFIVFSRDSWGLQPITTHYLGLINRDFPFRGTLGFGYIQRTPLKLPF